MKASQLIRSIQSPRTEREKEVRGHELKQRIGRREWSRRIEEGGKRERGKDEGIADPRY